MSCGFAMPGGSRLVPDDKAPRPTGSAPAVAAEVRSDRRDVLTSVGVQLRAERERRCITLAEVAGATKIRRSYLVAMERDDWEVLPAAVFARGFLRSYAEHLGVDPEHLLRVHQRQQRLARAADPSVAREESGARDLLEQIARARGVDTRSRWRWLIWNGLALAGIGVAVAVVWTLQLVAGARQHQRQEGVGDPRHHGL